MKFEVKTNNQDNYKSTFTLFLASAVISFVIILFNISQKLGTVSRHYEINYLCRLLIVEKSSLNFKKLSKLTNQTSKQKMWDLCRQIVK